VIHIQTFDGQAAAARQEAGVAQAQAAAAAQDAAAAARQQARDQAQMIRDQAQMIRDAGRFDREAGRPIIVRPPMSGPSPRQEKMMFAGFIMVVLAAVVIFHPLVRALARRLEGAGRKSDSLDASSAERLQRIEQALDAMAIEIERISEGQRFTTKLLSARAEVPAQLES
jgi:hypothetical protein